MIRSLHESVDGWVAGLVLRLEQAPQSERARRDGGPPRRKSCSTTSQERSSRTPIPTSRCCSGRAFPARVTAAMAQALTGQPTAGETLAATSRTTSPTSRLPTASPRTYHPLLPESSSCRRRCGSTPPRRWPGIRRTAGGPSRRRGSRRAAAELFGRRGLGQAPPSCSTATHRDCWRRPSPDPTGVAPRHFSQGLHGTALAPRLAGHRLDRVGDTPPASATSRKRSRRSDGTADTYGMFLAWTGLIFAYGPKASWSPWTPGSRCSTRSCGNPQFPSRGVETRVAGTMLVALTWRQPHHPQAAHWAERAIALARGHGPRLSRL